MDGGGGAAANVRVVRCPNCNKLLPEPPNFTVYRCGGCNTTLQAKQPSPVEATTTVQDSPRAKPNREEEEDDDKQLSGEPPATTEDTRRASKAPIVDPATTHSAELANFKLEESNASRELHHKQPWRTNADGGSRAREPPLMHSAACPAPALYPDEGPSDHRLYGYGDRETAGGVGHLEQGRAELLRKLDELRDQLRQSCQVSDRPKETSPASRLLPPPSAASSSYDDCGGRQTHFMSNVNGMGRTSFYPTMHQQNGIPAYREPPGPPPPPQGRIPFHHHPPAQYPQRSANNYHYGQQLHPDPVVSYHHDGFYRHDGFYHQPACSCLHCYNNHWLPPAHAPPPPVFSSNQRVTYPVNNHGFYPVDGHPMLAHQSFNQRVPVASVHQQEPRVQKRPAFAKKDGRSCRPVAGAAPFTVCHNCHNLLQIPEDGFLMEKQRKVRCGSCSQVILLEVDGSRLTTSATTKNIDTDGVLKDGLLSNERHSQYPILPYSEDFDSAGYASHSANDKLVLPTVSPISSLEMIEKEYGLNLSESEKRQGLSFSPTTSENSESPDSMICQRDLPDSAEIPFGTEGNSRVPSFPLREHFGYRPYGQVIDRSGKGSRSKRTEQEKILSLAANFKENSVKDESVATEMDFSVDEYLSHGFSQDSWEADKDEEEPKTTRGGESFFAGLIKKSFKDFPKFNQSMESGRSKVSVNGHPISDRIVKKAEKLAGTVNPGDYWYDYRAGFWGVMGHPCLGIIPPFIEEFNIPISKNCSGGNTGVLVNGRELHQKDLDLLVGRGLPASEDRSYVIEISGKVWDEATGEELDSLGKLAPTVEKVKHGFGMWVPRVGA